MRMTSQKLKDDAQEAVTRHRIASTLLTIVVPQYDRKMSFRRLPLGKCVPMPRQKPTYMHQVRARTARLDTSDPVGFVRAAGTQTLPFLVQTVPIYKTAGFNLLTLPHAHTSLGWPCPGS